MYHSCNILSRKCIISLYYNANTVFRAKVSVLTSKYRIDIRSDSDTWKK